MDEDLLDLNQVAKALHVSRSFLYQLIARGDIRAVHLGRLVRVHPKDLDEYMRKVRQETHKPKGRKSK